MLPLTAIGLSTMLCIPRTPDWGGFNIGVDNIEPYTPPLLIVNVPPCKSSIDKEPLFALSDKANGKILILFSRLLIKQFLDELTLPPFRMKELSVHLNKCSKYGKMFTPKGYLEGNFNHEEESK